MVLKTKSAAHSLQKF